MVLVTPVNQSKSPCHKLETSQSGLQHIQHAKNGKWKKHHKEQLRRTFSTFGSVRIHCKSNSWRISGCRIPHMWTSHYEAPKCFLPTHISQNLLRDKNIWPTPQRVRNKYWGYFTNVFTIWICFLFLFWCFNLNEGLFSIFKIIATGKSSLSQL